MSTRRKYEKPVDQLELTPRVDFSKETLLKPAEAAELLAVRPSWIYDAVSQRPAAGGSSGPPPALHSRAA
jgi:hypothetical protein